MGGEVTIIAPLWGDLLEFGHFFFLAQEFDPN